ncbi:MAG: carboxypeptidase-like regulatory domain-containing protein [Prevotella sp.]|nr:TonB-dependent receptor [Prevotella sp.]MDD7606058.1 carboxypeptidase-like regulatory domain-containing protein [Prevotellaceae bacterium]MDY3247294.1 carboxypeptidase-like regulatory domain-containing protein [Prevotella sp.]
MKKFILLLLATAMYLTAQGQTFVLQGKVTDEKDNPIEFVSVTCARQGKVAFTSLKGNFTLTLHSADSVVIRFSMLGYRAKTKVLRKPRGRQTLRVALYPDVSTLGEVQVQGQKIQSGQTQELKTKDMKMAPSAGGNAVEELIQSQAGVSTHSELSSQYNVRGGSFDENSVYINNVEVFRPFLVRSGQQEGLSVINPDMVERIGFSTGGFAAKYGDKMSSALDITYRRPKRFEANASASLLGASAYVGFATPKIAWANGLRYKTNKYLLGSLQENGEYRPNFLDYQTYLSYTPNKRWQIDFIGNISDSHYNFYPKDRSTAFGTMQNVMNFRVYFDGQEKDLFRTYFGSLSINRFFSPTTRLSLIASAYSTKERETYDIQGQYWLTQAESSENMAVGTYFEHARNYLQAHVENVKLILSSKVKKHDIEAAITLKREHIKENSTEYEMRDSAGYNIPHTGADLYMIYSMRAKNRLDATRTEAYVQDTWRFTSGTDSAATLYTLNYGLRMSHWNFNGETILSPRVSVGIIPAFNQNVTLRFATGLYYQAPFYKELRDTTTYNNITVAELNRKIKSQRSIHFVAGYDYRFNSMNRPFRFSAEAYYKILQNLIPYSVNNVKVVYYGDNVCSGHAAGIDLKLYGEFVPGTDSWISLSLMNTQMKLNGRSMPLPTDQRWSMNLFFTDYFPGTTKWKMALKLAYADGLPFSAPHREMERNSFRAPAYKRADIGMSYRLLDNENRSKKVPFKNIWLGIDCLNLLGINNVNSYYWITDVTNQQYAVPNYLTGRMLNGRILFEF